MNERRSTPPAPGLADARVDWAHGRVIGFSVSEDGAEAFDIIQLCLEGRVVASTVANLSVFELARDLSGLPLPSREQSAFELRVPEGCLLPNDLTRPSTRLTLRSARTGRELFEQVLHGVNELLHLTEGVPADLLFEVRFLGLRSGTVQGVVVDRHGCSVRPVLTTRLNDHPGEPLTIFEVSADGKVHHFQVPLRADRLTDGANLLQICSPEGQPLASFPIQMGAAAATDTERRVQLLEAQLDYFKHLMLTQTREGLSARLALLKSEVVGICSDMLALQRTNFEREALALVRTALAQALPPTGDEPGEAGAADLERARA